MYSDSKTEQSEYSPRNYEQSSRENMGIVETNHRLDDVRTGMGQAELVNQGES